MARQLGLGTIFKVDDDDSGSVFTTITLSLEGTPPNRTRRKIPGEVLGDTLATYMFGIEDYSTVSFVIYCEVNDTQHAMLRTLFTNKSQVLWNFTYASADVEQADYVISSIVPRSFGVDTLLAEEITLERMGSIAYS